MRSAVARGRHHVRLLLPAGRSILRRGMVASDLDRVGRLGVRLLDCLVLRTQEQGRRPDRLGLIYSF